MAQHDYILANQSGAAFRSDLNNGLAAIVSQNSGAAQPSTTYAYQWWADTTTGLLKIRNAANNAWITLFQLDGEWTTLALENGTAAAPSLYFKDSGTDTGLFSPGANQLAISTGGVQRLLVDASGNLTASGGLTAANLNGGPLAGFRNVIINGNPTINQRGYVSGAATSGANQYTLDRWRVVTSGQNISFTDSANVRTVTAPAGGCEQVVEGASILSGTYTLNWTGTATATVGGIAVAKGGNVTLTGGTNATVRFSSGTFSLVQLEPGTVATPFEYRPFGIELMLCQRYYEVGNGDCVSYGASGAVTQRFTQNFITTKATAATTTITKIGGDATAIAVATVFGNLNGFSYGIGSASAGQTLQSYWTASAEL
jgi:hypothetical protein